MENKYISYLEDIVKGIVKNPEDVKIEKIKDDMGILLKLSLSKEDLGVVIGKGGETIKAIRTLINIVGRQENAKVSVKIIE